MTSGILFAFSLSLPAKAMANSIRVDHPESQTNCCFFFASWQEVLGPQKAISFAGLLTLFGNPIWRTRGQPKSQDLRSRIKRGQVDHSLIFFGSRQQFELRQMKEIGKGWPPGRRSQLRPGVKRVTGYSGHRLRIRIRSTLILTYAKWTTKLTASTVCCFWVSFGQYPSYVDGV